MISHLMQVPYVPGGRDWDGADCWGLVLLCLDYLMHVKARGHDGIYFEPGCSPESAEKGIEIALTTEPEFVQVSIPKRGDFVLLSVLNHPVHIGFMMGPNTMLHTRENTGPSIADLSSPRWARRVRGYYRHKDLT